MVSCFDYENEDDDEDDGKNRACVMNPETPQPSRDEIEAKLTALLLGELPAPEAQLLRWAISQDAALGKLHDRLKLTVGFVREVAASPAEATPAQTAPLKLSSERREKLLAHFKTIAPKEFVPLVPPLKKRREFSSLLALAAAVAIIGVLAAMLLPALSAAKSKSRGISAMSQAREREIKYRLAADEADVAKNSIIAVTSLPAAPEQRVPALEAYTQNGASTITVSPKQEIVLPQIQDSFALETARKPAVATPSAPDFFNSGSIGGVATRDRGEMPSAQNNLSWEGNVQTIANSSFGNGSGGRGGNGGAGGESHGFILAGPVGNSGDAWQAAGKWDTTPASTAGPVASAAPVLKLAAKNEFSDTALSGQVFIDDGVAQQLGDKSSFYRDIASGSDADTKTKVPVLGDMPVAGRLFESKSSITVGAIEAFRNMGEDNTRSSVRGLYDDNFSTVTNRSDAVTVPVVDASGNFALADDLSKSGTGSLGLIGNNAYNGLTTIGGGTLNVPESAAKPLARLPGVSMARDDSFALNTTKDGNGNLGYGTFDQSSGAAGLSGHATDSEIAAAPPSPPVSKYYFQARLSPQNQAAASSAPAPVYAPSGEVTQKVKRGINLQGGTAFTVNLDYTTNSAAAVINEDRPIQKTSSPSPVPQPEMLTSENAFSTFSLNVSDVSFKLAAASLEKGQLPDTASIRTEEFINAFNYHDPEPAVGVPVAFVSERARYPFAHNRDLLRFSLKTAAAGRQPGRPLNLVLLLDNSGSMERADRVAIIHEALRVLASQLQPQDTISIITFARTARLWVDGAHGDQAGTAVNQVSDLTPEGGTNLEEAMNLAYATARRHYLANGVNRVVLLTDGAANLGNVDPEALKQKVEAQRKQGIALDCFGIGWEGYNDDLLEQLSSNGDGRYGFINTPEAATTEFAAQLAGALHVAAQDVKVQVEFNPGRVTSYRQIGYAKHQLTKEQFRDNTVDAAEIAAQEAGNALYTVEVNPQGIGPVATVRVRYKVPGTGEYREQAWEVPFDGNAPALENSSSAMRLAATTSAFSEWLASSPYAQEVTTDQLLNYLSGVPAIYGADARPKQLETMIREAKSLSGK